MRTDLRYKLLLAAIVSASLLFISLMTVFMLFSNSIWVGLIPLYMLAFGFTITFILGFVPFMKDHMWLSVTAAALLCALAGFILSRFI